MVEPLKAPSLSFNDAPGDDSSTFAADPPSNAAKHPAQREIDLKSLTSTKTDDLTQKLLDIIEYARTLEVLEVSPCEYQSTQAHMAFEACDHASRDQRCPHLQPAGIVSRQLCRYSQQLERICRYIAPGGDVMLVASMERDVTCLVDAFRSIQDCIESQAHTSAVVRFISRNSAQRLLEFIKFHLVITIVSMELAVSFHRLRVTAMLKAKVAEVVERAAAVKAEITIAALDALEEILDVLEESGQLVGSKQVIVAQACTTTTI